jgi:hypothetical protein
VLGDTHCTNDLDIQPPRIAGPLISLGMAVAFAARGLRPVGWFEIVALSLSLLTGSTAVFWMARGANPDPGWLPAVYTLCGALLVLLAGLKRRSHDA